MNRDASHGVRSRSAWSGRVTRYVITPDIALRLAAERAPIPTGTQLVAPTLLRSQVLSMLYGCVRDGRRARADVQADLDYVRGLRIRLLGDRVLQTEAWKVAVELDWPDTFDAEYIALTKLQADALVTGDADLEAAASKLASVASFDQLLESDL